MATSTRGTNPNLSCLDRAPDGGFRDMTFDLSQMAAAEHRSTSGERVDQLRRMIETQIIPRLMLVTRQTACTPEAHRPDLQRAEFDEVQQLADLLLEGNTRGVNALVATLTEAGASRAAILLDLFAPAARRLGVMWETDECTFADVTIAMGSLQQALRMLDPAPHETDDREGPQRSILLGLVTGEQHSFPVQLLDVLFQQSGWAVETEMNFTRSRAASALHKRRFDAVGLSISRDSLLDQLACDIESLRRASRNPAMIVLVGGRVFSGHPELVAQVGADATADDAASAVHVAERLVFDARSARR